MRVRIFLHVLCLFSISLASESAGPDYRQEMQKWRADYESSLKQENGWLSLAGLFWLQEGDNTFGASSGDTIVLPPGSAPARAGRFIFHNGQTQLLPSQGTAILLNGEPVHSPVILQPDSSGRPDRLTLGRLSMMVIKRGPRYAIRLWDSQSPTRLHFSGVRWFPVNQAYRVTAEFASYPQPKMIPVVNILGDTEPVPSPGYATFELAGKPCRLEPVLEDDHLFFIFKDATSGRETYPSGRFLYTALPSGGQVVLDFNQAENPPCAFTPYATCPLPPKQNRLSVAVEAGERNHEHAGN